MANNNNNNTSQVSINNESATTSPSTIDLDAMIQRAVKTILSEDLRTTVEATMKDLEKNEKPSDKGKIPPMPDLSEDEQLDFLFWDDKLFACR